MRFPSGWSHNRHCPVLARPHRFFAVDESRCQELLMGSTVSGATRVCKRLVQTVNFAPLGRVRRAEEVFLNTGAGTAITSRGGEFVVRRSL